MKFTLAATIVFLLMSSGSYSQTSAQNLNKDNIRILKSEILKMDPEHKELSLNTSIQQSSKSPGLALLFSLIVPGAGHYYINRMDVGKYFFGADVASWLGYISLNVYGDNVSDDSKTFSVEHAQVASVGSQNDDYWTNIGSFSNIYEYNNDQLLQGNYNTLYNVNQYYWDWDNMDNMNIYETQRKSSERIYNTRIVFGSLLIVNRIVSGISAYLLAKNQNKTTSSLNIQPELLYKNQYSIDGVKINLSKNF